MRHGAKPKIANKRRETDIETLDKSQEPPAWPATYTYPVPPGWSADRKSKEFSKKRQAMAARALEEFVKQARVVPGKGFFQVDLEDEAPPNAPESLFGIPVRYSVETESKWLA